MLGEEQDIEAEMSGLDLEVFALTSAVFGTDSQKTSTLMSPMLV